MTVPAIFARIGEETERQWRAAHYDDRAFAGIACEVLGRFASRVPAAWKALEWVASAATLPHQQDPHSTFGDLAVTVWNGPRFQLDLYWWLEGSTSIHQHMFSGAFCVLEGSSFHSRYRFRERARVTTHLRLGDLELADVELLERGALRPIESGEALVHALFHLDHPSVTLCLRTHEDDGTGPQWNYEWPGLATDPFFVDPVTRKREQLVRLVRRAGDARGTALVEKLVEASDLETALRVLAALYPGRSAKSGDAFTARGEPEVVWDSVVAAARRRHGRRAGVLLAVLAERERIVDLTRRRAAITRADHRFFLALLLNVRDRARFLALVRRRFPRRDPVQTVVNWARELGAGEANALGLPDAGPELFAVLAGLLAGEDEPTLARRLSHEARALARALRAAHAFSALLSHAR